MYFKNCSSLDEVKAVFKTLAKQFHPDCGGDNATMQAILEYSYACAKVIKDGNLTAQEAEEGIRLSEEYRTIIERLMPISGILIEVVGHWIWVTGATFAVRKELKDAGLYFASKKVAWYYRSIEHATKGGKKTLDEIRAKYGSKKVNSRYQSYALK